MTLDEFDLRLIATRRFGDVAVVVAESARRRGLTNGDAFAMTFRYTDVWVREGNGWRLALATLRESPLGRRSSCSAVRLTLPT